MRGFAGFASGLCAVLDFWLWFSYPMPFPKELPLAVAIGALLGAVLIALFVLLLFVFAVFSGDPDVEPPRT